MRSCDDSRQRPAWKLADRKLDRRPQTIKDARIARWVLERRRRRAKVTSMTFDVRVSRGQWIYSHGSMAKETSERGGLRVRLATHVRDPSLRREADAMGFYVCVALIAALTIGNEHGDQPRLLILEIVWVTTLLLAFTHWFAVSIAARLVADPDDHHTPLQVLAAEMSIAGIVAITATLVVLIVPHGYERLGARITAAVGITLIVGLELLASGSSRGRAMIWSLIALAFGVAIASAKWFIGK